MRLREEDDWRLNGQISYLHGAHLALTVYRPDFPGHDHEHCEFCWQKIAAIDAHDADHEGYATNDLAQWVCKECFTDFHEMFAWTVDELAPSFGE